MKAQFERSLVEEGDEIEGDELEKRQRLLSSDSNQIKENKKKQSNLEVMVPEKYNLDVKDTLLTLCPINNMQVIDT